MKKLILVRKRIDIHQLCLDYKRRQTCNELFKMFVCTQNYKTLKTPHTFSKNEN